MVEELVGESAQRISELASETGVVGMAVFACRDRAR